MSKAAQIQAQREFEFTDSHFRFLAKLANTRTGIVLADHKRDMVYGRLVRRLRALKLDSFTAYCELLQSEAGEAEMGNLVNAITTNLTSFYREAHHFEHLAEVLRETTTKQPSGRIRLWSSACSSGMEPYSMAMTVRSAISDLGKWDTRILATDIDTNMVNTGATGEYSASDVEDVPSECKKYIQRGASAGRVRMSDELKSLIAFKQLNLLESWPMKGPFDAIFCRNVVIYFDKPTKQKLFARMADIIKPGGWLYIGHSENLHGITDRFELQGRTVYRRVK